MVNLLYKELRLSTSPLTYIFLLFSLMVFIPDYPILMSAFFICLGIFQSFQQARVSNDILYTSLLPIKKDDVVTSKFSMVLFFEIISFILIVIFSLIRNIYLKDSSTYVQSHMQCPNLFFLGFVLLMFAAFNLIFVKGFFKTADKINMPYLLFVVTAIIITGLGEMFHFIPALNFLNDTIMNNISKTAPDVSFKIRLIIFIICLIIFIAGTFIAVRTSKKSFQKINM